MNKQERRAQCHCTSTTDKSALSLAVRECVFRLSLDPDGTMNVIGDRNIEGSQLIKESDDFVKLVALSTLKKLFRSLKSEICRADDDSAQDFSNILHFLQRNSEEKLSDIVRRYAYENELKSGRTQLKSFRRNSWHELDVLPASEKFQDGRRPVPFNVPPLDPVQVEQCYDAVTPRSTGKQTDDYKSSKTNRTPLKIISDEIIHSSEESSCESVSDDAVSKLQTLSQQVANDVINSARIIQNVVSPTHCSSVRNDETPIRRKLPIDNRIFIDKNCGTTPREFSNCSDDEKNNFHTRNCAFPNTSLKNLLRDVEKTVKVSKEVQTNFDDVSTKIESEEDSPSFTMNSLKIAESSSATINSSSTFPSQLSAGQIPLRKAVHLLESDRRQLISVNVDGSIDPSISFNNYCNVKPSLLTLSTPKRLQKSESLRRRNFGTEKYFQHFGEIISSGNSTNFSAKDRYEDYGIPLREKSTSSFLLRHSDNEIDDVPFSPRSPRIHGVIPDNAPTLIQTFGEEENPSAVAPLVAREVSLLTSFDSSNTATKHVDFEQYRRLIASSLTPTTLGDERSAIGNGEEATSYETEVAEEIVEVVKNRSFSSVRSFHTKHLTKTAKSSSSSKVFTNNSRRDEEDEEESTLNQISPLPTTG